MGLIVCGRLMLCSVSLCVCLSMSVFNVFFLFFFDY